MIDAADRYIASLERKRSEMLKEITETVVTYEIYRDTVMRASELQEVIAHAKKVFKGDEDNEGDGDR